MDIQITHRLVQWKFEVKDEAYMQAWNFVSEETLPVIHYEGHIWYLQRALPFEFQTSLWEHGKTVLRPRPRATEAKASVTPVKFLP